MCLNLPLVNSVIIILSYLPNHGRQYRTRLISKRSKLVEQVIEHYIQQLFCWSAIAVTQVCYEHKLLHERLSDTPNFVEKCVFLQVKKSCLRTRIKMKWKNHRILQNLKSQCNCCLFCFKVVCQLLGCHVSCL